MTAAGFLTPFGMTPRAVRVKKRSAAAVPPLNAPLSFVGRTRHFERSEKSHPFHLRYLCTAGFAIRQGNSTTRSSAGLQIRQDGRMTAQGLPLLLERAGGEAKNLKLKVQYGNEYRNDVGNFKGIGILCAGCGDNPHF
jgi:hypothetical protein